MKRIFIIIFILLTICGLGGYIYYYAQNHEALDTTPSITLIGEEDIHLSVGEHYYEPGFIAQDYTGNDITRKVEFNRINPQEAGEYEIKYQVTDCGRTTEVSRTVTVSYPEEGAEIDQDGIAVLMYHYVYDPLNPPATLNSNFISTDALEAQLKYFTDNKYYFPSWQEVRDYVDGKISLPEKSVVLTFDDCSNGFIKNGIPLLEKYNVKATSFVICSKNGIEMAEENLTHVTFQSHSYDMHKGGGNIGHGGVFTALSYEDGLADLNKSIEILGSSEAFAYPFGDYSDTCRQAVQDAGFLVGFTTVNGKIHPGDDPMLLNRVRVDGSLSLEELISDL